MSCLVTSSRLVFFHWKNVITLIIWPKRMPGSRYEANVIWIVNFIQYSSKQFHTIKFIVHAPWIIALLNLKNLKAIKKIIILIWQTQHVAPIYWLECINWNEIFLVCYLSVYCLIKQVCSLHNVIFWVPA